MNPSSPCLDKTGDKLKSRVYVPAPEDVAE